MSKKYEIGIETMSKPRGGYATKAYLDLGLPVAPAIMADGDIVVEGSDISEERLEVVIRRRLGLAPISRKGLFGRMFKRG